MVHEADALADLPDEHHAIHLGQVIIVVDDPLKELATLHTARGWTTGSLWGAPCPEPSSCRALCPPEDPEPAPAWGC